VVIELWDEVWRGPVRWAKGRRGIAVEVARTSLGGYL
jgi:hypothetical protein